MSYKYIYIYTLNMCLPSTTYTYSNEYTDVKHLVCDERETSIKRIIIFNSKHKIHVSSLEIHHLN